MFSLTPLKIWRGRVRCCGLARNSATTISSNEVTKANSAPETTPGAMIGSVTVRNAWRGEAPEARGGAGEIGVEALQGRRHGDDDERQRQHGVRQDEPDVGADERERGEEIEDRDRDDDHRHRERRDEQPEDERLQPRAAAVQPERRQRAERRSRPASRSRRRTGCWRARRSRADW